MGRVVATVDRILDVLTDKRVYAFTAGAFMVGALFGWAVGHSLWAIADLAFSVLMLWWAL
jgi:hypothetical protein